MEGIKKIEQECRELYLKWREAESRLSEEKLKKINLDFIGKFVKFKNPISDDVTYMYVRDVHDNKTAEMKYCYRVCGFGFNGEMLGAVDNTWFDWDFEKEIFIDGYTVEDFKNHVDLVQEITAEEFNEEYERLVEQMKLHHRQYFNAILFGKNEDLTQE